MMIRIGLCQCKLLFEQPEENLAMMERFLLYAQGRAEEEKGDVRSISQDGVAKMPASALKPDLLLFPELTLTGFTMKSREFAISRGSEMIERVREMAVRYEMAIGFGCVTGEPGAHVTEPGAQIKEPAAQVTEPGAQITETDPKDSGIFEKVKNGSEENEQLKRRPKNTYLIIDKEGRLLADYAKLHPFSYAGENMHYSPGNSLSTFALNGVRFGITICYDLRFPEIYQAYADSCDVIIAAANWPAKRAEHWNALLKARAIETQCYIAAVNCVGDMDGQYYQGDSQVIGPDGESLQERWVDIHSEKVNSLGKGIRIESEEAGFAERRSEADSNGEKASPEGILLAELDEERVRQVREAFPVRQDRRKGLYTKMYSVAGRMIR